MFNFHKKRLARILSAVFLALSVCGLIPSIRIPIVSVFKNPLVLFSLLGREVRGILLYHHNFIQNERLEKEVDLLRQKLSCLREVSLENERLRNLLAFKQQLPFKAIAARVIARYPDNWSSVVIIDKGSYHGIRQKMTVITYLGLVGSVIETSYSMSKVMLANDPDFGVSCLIQRSRQEGLVSGTLGNFLIMKYLPKDADVKVSDTVVTSGFSPKFPKGLIIGTVADVEEEFSGLGRYCLVRPAVNLSSIEEVLVVIQ